MADASESVSKRAKVSSNATVIVAATPEDIPTAAVDGKITIVYWNICGLGQPIRYALELAGVEYVDVRVEPGPGAAGTPGYKKMWFDRKPAVSETVIFANLPYMFDAEVALAQSNTILKHIGRKFGLMGDSASADIVDLVLDQMADFDGESTGRCYRDIASMKPYCEDLLPGKLKDWEKLLGEKPFLTGDKVTVAYLKLYETLRKLQIIEFQPQVGTKTMARFSKLVAFIKRVEALPAMSAYMDSSIFMPRPLNNEHAQFK